MGDTYRGLDEDECDALCALGQSHCDYPEDFDEDDSLSRLEEPMMGSNSAELMGNNVEVEI